MARVTWKLSDPADPMYREPLRAYQPHWARQAFDLDEPSPPPRLTAERQSEPPEIQLRRLQLPTERLD
jgi:hypothetical protein